MTCTRIDLGDGVVGIVCTRDRPAAPCELPGCGRPHVRLCDWPVQRSPGKWSTCSLRLCEAHAAEHPERDYCPAHEAVRLQRGPAPTVLNRNRYLPTPGFGPGGDKPRTGRERRPELPAGSIYVGRGTPLGNPYPRHMHPGNDPQGRPLAISHYRGHLFRKVQARDPRVLAALGRITVDSFLVCSCAPGPCHADEIAACWRWLTMKDTASTLWAACVEAALVEDRGLA